MGEGKPQNLRDLWSRPFGIGFGGAGHDDDDHVHMKKKDEEDCATVDTAASSSLTSSIGNDDSTVSNGSSSSIDDDTRDDASSTATSSSAGALYDLSDLIEELPIKRGLSRYYDGKSDSFTCLSRVTSVEDLAKKEAPSSGCIRKNNKGINKCRGGLNSYRFFTLPRPVISKKASRSSLPNYDRTRGRGCMNCNSRKPPQVPSGKAFHGGG